MSWIDSQIPASVGRHIVTSNPDGAYNCIAYAAGVNDEWWSHAPGYKWPAPDRTPSVEGLIAVFAGLGFEKCVSHAIEQGYDKVVLYVKEGEWTHAARQIESGKWVSKLGPDEDIEHDSPECLCGESYGTIHCIMRKAK